MSSKARQDVQKDYNRTTERILQLSCHDDTAELILAELSRWNNPGTSGEMSFDRFLNTNNLKLPTPSSNNHPTLVLFRAAKTMMKGTDSVQVRKSHWDEVAIDPRWRSHIPTRLIPDNDAAPQARPLYKALKKCLPNSSTRPHMGISNTYELFMFDAVCRAVNSVLAASGDYATLEEVEPFVGKKQVVVRPMRQISVKWHTLTTSKQRRVAVWTLAAACSIWGLEFLDSFLEFCTAALVGPVCGVTRQECKEGFAACVAVATVARARTGGPMTYQDIAGCTRAMWVFDVIERACATANGTLWASRTIVNVEGDRIPVQACDRWETPVNASLVPANSFSVIGPDCAHVQKDNGDGTHGESCAGRWVVVTKLEDLGQEQIRDGKMRVTLTHGNAYAASNVLAVLETFGQWGYIQGQNECLTCAYKRALRHGFPVIIDSPKRSTEPVAVVQHNTSPLSFGGQLGILLLPFLVLACLVRGAAAQSATATSNPYPLNSNIFKPNATCEHFTSPPIRHAISWTALVSLIRGLQSVVVTIAGIRSGKRFVRRTPFNVVTCIVTTFLAGFSGWINTSGCASYKAVGVLKGLITAAVNRLAYEVVDILCMVTSIGGIIFPLIYFNVASNSWALVQPPQLALVVLSASYFWRWLDTGKKQSMSQGVVSTSLPLLVSHIAAFVFTMFAFVIGKQKENQAADVASYISDALLMTEVLMQFLLLQ